MAAEKARGEPTISEDHSELLEFFCELCGESFDSGSDLRSHCGTPEHRFVLMSDEEHPWKHRPPPPLHCTPKKELSICQSRREQGWCQMRKQCCYAHSDDELNEWKERLDFRREKVKEAHNMPRKV
ncbi:zinc finger CCCH domain-containing protein 7A-like [Haemaphysalis longicornis]